MTKTNGSYRTAQPVLKDPYPTMLRNELATIARAGGTVDRVEELGFGQYRIHYTLPEHFTMVVDAGIDRVDLLTELPDLSTRTVLPRPGERPVTGVGPVHHFGKAGDL